MATESNENHYQIHSHLAISLFHNLAFMKMKAKEREREKFEFKISMPKKRSENVLYKLYALTVTQQIYFPLPFFLSFTFHEKSASERAKK
jgi:hypothetical protein